MRFCQTDGTPLVDGPEPVDPYKTMVARPEDIAAAIPPMPDKSQAGSRVEDEVLEIPPAEVSDPKKTMYASEAEIRKAMAEVDPGDNEVIDVPPLSEPEPPKFIEPALGSTPPPFTGLDQREPSPHAADDLSSKTTPPIPSPFAEPKFASEPQPAADRDPDPMFASDPFTEPERPAAEPPPSPFAAAAEPPSSSLVQADSTPTPAAQDTNWQDKPMQNPQFEGAAGATQSKTLAIVSLVLGILSFLCCGLFVPALAAVVTGFMARSKANSDPNSFGGAGLATAGLVLGVISILSGVIYWIWVLFLGGMEMIMRMQ